MNILVVAAHMDDAEIYAGGTLIKYSREGHKVFVCVCTNGNKGSHKYPPERLTEIRRCEQIEAAKAYGGEVFFLDYEDNLVIDCKQLRLDIIEATRKTAADVLITHFPQDPSNDHKTIGKAVRDSIVGLKWGNMPVKSAPIAKAPLLLFMDTMAGVGFLPEIYVDISDVIDLKRQAFLKHVSQVECDAEYGRCVEVLSEIRGMQNGTKYAEGFIAHKYPGGMLNYKLLP